MTRKLLKDVDEGDRDLDSFYKSDYIDHIKIAERSFDKSITAIRIAMNSLSEIISGVEHDWVIQEWVLMRHKYMFHVHWFVFNCSYPVNTSPIPCTLSIKSLTCLINVTVLHQREVDK